MKAGRKKRGWVYRGLCITASVLAVLMFLAWIFAEVCMLESRWPLGPNSLFMIDMLNGGAYFAYVEHNYYSHVVIDVHGPRISNLKSICSMPFGIDMNAPFGGWDLHFPLWFPFIVFLIWPVFELVKKYTVQHVTDCCTSCGYDLRGSVGSSTCPECGAAIKQQTTSP